MTPPSSTPCREGNEAGVLEPCPFDGGEAVLKWNDLDERYSYGRSAWVECCKCGARTANYYHDDARGYADRETANPKAITAWNSRTQPPPLSDEGMQ